jgi:hypothetical protein
MRLKPVKLLTWLPKLKQKTPPPPPPPPTAVTPPPERDRARDPDPEIFTEVDISWPKPVTEGSGWRERVDNHNPPLDDPEDARWRAPFDQDA